MTETTLDFTDHMRVAQEAHQQGDFPVAEGHWVAAEGLAPDGLDRARALRGRASTLDRWRGPDEALPLAKRAADIHSGLYNVHPDDYGVVREVPESLRVWGRLLLQQGVQAELSDVPSRTFFTDARVIFRLGDEAIDTMQERRGRTANPEVVPDQHEVNWWSYRSLVEAFAPHGDRALAKAQARLARQTAGYSEAHDLPTAANISPEYAAKANVAARVRALGASIVAELVTPQPSARRRTALWIASKII